MRTLSLDLGAVRLDALAWGPDPDDTGRPLAVLLHGFPDTAYTWRHLGPVLADAGHRVVAPFTRGYAPSDVPADRSGHVGPLFGGSDGHAWLPRSR